MRRRCGRKTRPCSLGEKIHRFLCDLSGVRQGGGMRAALDRACVLRPDGDIGHAAKPAAWRARGTLLEQVIKGSGPGRGRMAGISDARHGDGRYDWRSPYGGDETMKPRTGSVV